MQLLGGNINIIGQGFDNCTVRCPPYSFAVGGRPCTNAKFVNPSTYSCTVPAGVGKDLNVEATFHNVTSPPNTLFSYVAPSISKVQPNKGPVLDDLQVTIEGSNFRPDLTWSPNVAVLLQSSSRTINCSNPQFDGAIRDRVSCTLSANRVPGDLYKVFIRIENQMSPDNNSTFYSTNILPQAFDVETIGLQNDYITVDLSYLTYNPNGKFSIHITKWPVNGVLYKFAPGQPQYSDLDLIAHGDYRSIAGPASPKVVYAPNFEYYGDDAFQYRVEDDIGLSLNVRCLWVALKTYS